METENTKPPRRISEALLFGELLEDCGGNHAMVRRWLERGDGCAVYCNAALDSANCGHRIFLSYGSRAAQIELVDAVQDAPPAQMPDTGRFATPWAYRLEGVCRRDQNAQQGEGHAN